METPTKRKKMMLVLTIPSSDVMTMRRRRCNHEDEEWAHEYAPSRIGLDVIFHDDPRCCFHTRSHRCRLVLIDARRENKRSGMATQPSQTIYVRNLDRGVRRNELKRTLYVTCLEYGHVLDVVVSNAPAAAGQAWVVFKDVDAAVRALQGLQSALVYGRLIAADYARQPSFAAAPAQRAVRDKARRELRAAAAAAGKRL